jgi:hypothetical protein
MKLTEQVRKKRMSLCTLLGSEPENGGKSKMLAKRAVTLSLPITAVAIALAIVPGTMSAAPIIITTTGSGPGSGNVSLANMPGSLLGVSGGANPCIDFGYPAPCQSTTGIQDAVSSLDTTNFTSGTSPLDTIKDLFLAGPTPLTAFETVASPLPGGVVTFDLLSLIAPMPSTNNCVSASVGTQCVPTGSPLLLTQTTATQVNVQLTANLAGYTGTSATGTTAYTAIFSTSLSGTLPTMAGNPFSGAPDTIPNILAFIGSGGTITSTWQAQESPNPVIPEPFSFVLLGSGLVTLSLIGRRRIFPR